jgi:signal transduction histidine kinase
MKADFALLFESRKYMKIAQTTETSERRLVRVRLYKDAALRKQYVATIPRWRRAPVGYFMSILFTGAAFAGTFLFHYVPGVMTFPDSFFILSVLLTALIWGVGSAIFSLILSTILIDYFFVAPVGQINLYNWNGITQVLPFIIAGLVIAFITGQRERARLQSLAAEQELQAYADELETSNERLKEANSQLKDTDELKDRFLSIASHELKTPVTSIRGQAQLAIRRLARQKNVTPEIEGMSTTLEKINEQTTRLTSLIDELLDVSSIRAGKIELHKRDCELVALCQDVIEDQQLLSGRTITLDAEPPVIHLLADNDRLMQVVANLITNAIKYSAQDKPIAVCVRQNETQARLEVQDSGKGISEHQLPHIFDTFYRTPDAQASSKFGLGLGLAICKDIVERHGGRIWCESKIGKGSTFFVELPKR